MSYRTDTLAISDAPLDIRKAWPLYADLVDIDRPSTRPVIDHRLKGEGNGFIRFLTLLETKQPDGTDRKGRPEEDRWCYLVVSSDIGVKPVKDQMRIANRLLQAFDGRLFRPRVAYSGVKMAEIAPEQKPRNIMDAMWLLARDHPDRYLLTCRRCMRTVLSGTQGGERSFCSNSCRATWSKEHSAKKR